MSIEQLRKNIPDFAKDIRINLSNLFGNIAQTGLTEGQFYGIALSISYCLNNTDIINAILQEGVHHLTEEIIKAAKIAATLMAMNNVYYRAIHFSKNTDLLSMPANLRMSSILNPGVSKIDFELFSLAVSGLNGCGICIHAHVKELLECGLNIVAIQSTIRIAAIFNAVKLTLS